MPSVLRRTRRASDGALLTTYRPLGSTPKTTAIARQVEPTIPSLNHFWRRRVLSNQSKARCRAVLVILSKKEFSMKIPSPIGEPHSVPSYSNYTYISEYRLSVLSRKVDCWVLE